MKAQDYERMDEARRRFRTSLKDYPLEKCIADYLRETEGCALRGDSVLNRLVVLASHANDESWELACRIYEYAEMQNLNEGLYATWTILGFRYIEGNDLSSDAKPDCPLEYRVKVAQDLEQILLRAIGSYPDNSGFLELIGKLYYHHPLRADVSLNQEMLQKAIHWVQKAVAVAAQSDDSVDTLPWILLGDIYFELSLHEQARASYKRVNVEQCREEFGSAEVERLQARLRECG